MLLRAALTGHLAQSSNQCPEGILLRWLGRLCRLHRLHSGLHLRLGRLPRNLRRISGLRYLSRLLRVSRLRDLSGLRLRVRGLDRLRGICLRCRLAFRRRAGRAKQRHRRCRDYCFRNRSIYSVHLFLLVGKDHETTI